MSEILRGEQIDSYFEETMLPEKEAVVQAGGSFKDYMLTTSAIGMDIYYPETLTVQKDTEGVLDFSDEDFKAYFDAQPTEAKRNMMNASSNDEAYKIGMRNSYQHESMNRISEDGIVTQLGMSLVPGLINPSSVLPVSMIGGTLFRASLGAGRIVAATAAGAAGGAVANIIDESVFEARNMHYDYFNAALYGAAFGGVLGTGAGVLDTMFRGPYGDRNAEIIATSQEHIVPQGQGLAEGVVAEPLKKNVFDKVIPILTDDIHTSHQSVSPIIRKTISKVASSMSALKDEFGNFVVQGRAGKDYRTNFQSHMSNLDIELGDIHYKSDSGISREAFETEISKAYAEVSNKQELDAYEAGIRAEEAARREGVAGEELRKVRREARDNHYNKEIDWGRKPPYVVEGVKRYAKYYKNVAESGKSLQMKAFKDINTNKLYKTRMVDYNKVGDTVDAGLATAVKRAFELHPGNRDLTPEEMGQLVSHYVDFLNDASYRQNFSHDSYLLPSTTEMPASARLKGRKFRLDESQLNEYLVTDMKELTSMYNYQMGGRQALQYSYGTDKIGDMLEDVKMELVAEGNAHLIETDFKALRRSIEDVGGTLRMNPLSQTPAWTATRIATSVQSVRLMGRAGINQLIELMGNVAMNHMPSMMKSGIGRNMKDTAKLLKHSDGSPRTELSKAIMNAGFLQDALSNHHINRAADIDVGFNSGKVEKFFNNLNSKYFMLNGMRPIKMFQEHTIGGALINEIGYYSDKATLSKAEEARLSAWGVTHQQVKDVHADMSQYLNMKEGKLGLFEMEQSNRDAFQLMLTRDMDSTVLQGDNIYVANAFKDSNQIQKLMLQFMRYPSMAHNVFLRKGLADDKARMGGALIGNMLAYMTFKYLQEEAAVNLGLLDEHKRQYNFFKDNADEDIKRGVLGSLNYGAPLGMLTTGWNYGTHLVGAPELGRDYVTADSLAGIIGGPSLDMAESILDLGQHAFGAGKMTDERAMLKLKTVTAGQNFPIWDEGLKDLIKENY